MSSLFVIHKAVNHMEWWKYPNNLELLYWYQKFAENSKGSCYQKITLALIKQKECILDMTYGFLNFKSNVAIACHRARVNGDEEQKFQRNSVQKLTPAAVATRVQKSSLRLHL